MYLTILVLAMNVFRVESIIYYEYEIMIKEIWLTIHDQVQETLSVALLLVLESIMNCW